MKNGHSWRAIDIKSAFIGILWWVFAMLIAAIGMTPLARAQEPFEVSSNVDIHLTSQGIYSDAVLPGSYVQLI